MIITNEAKPNPDSPARCPRVIAVRNRAALMAFAVALACCKSGSSDDAIRQDNTNRARVETQGPSMDAGPCEPLPVADANIQHWHDAVPALCRDNGEWPRDVSLHSCPGYRAIAITEADTVTTHFFSESSLAIVGKTRLFATFGRRNVHCYGQVPPVSLRECKQMGCPDAGGGTAADN